MHSLFSKLLLFSVGISSVLTSDLDTVRSRRYSEIVGAATGAKNIPAWLSTLGPDGKWTDSGVDYATGCDGSPSSWQVKLCSQPAQQHWVRLNTLSAAWHGGFKNALNYSGDPGIRASISLAMNYWFSNDFQIASCIDSGGEAACPCRTPGFWNTNWFANIILVPTWVAQVCLLLGSSLSASELASCQLVTGRSFDTFQTGINGVSSITGANLLGIASIGIDLALLTSNSTMLADAYSRVHDEVTIKSGIKVDGIRADGTFGQHSGLTYNGNYGDQNDVFNLEIAAGSTEFQANSTSVAAFSTLIMADLWMSFYNTLTKVAHWDFSVIGRYISLPVSSNESSASLKTNFTQLQVLGQEWNSSTMLSVFNAWNSSPTDANIGAIQGNRIFYANDYIVQRGAGYVSTLKLYSKRTVNSECVNSQNPFGFHLSDGATYTYITGNEYEDIFAAWDWNLIPGITVDYNGTSLNCTGITHTGTQSFVGGVSDGKQGIAVMRYETPSSKALNWRKTWFFLSDDVQVVFVARITSTNPVPVFSVLDQKKLVGDVLVDGIAQSSGNYTGATSLWHAGVGYLFNSSSSAATLSLQLGTRTGSWAPLGTTGQPDATFNLFAAWLNHTDLTAPVSYSIYPATSSFADFEAKVNATQIEVVRNDGSISALLDLKHSTLMLAYWETAGGSEKVPSTVAGFAPLTVASNANAVVIIHMDTWNVTVSDPTQTSSSVTLTFTLGSGIVPAGWTGAKSKTLVFSLPQGATAGDSVTLSLN
ncbi:polysaccharide lyase family 8 protein [Mycena floridula]|nr:polysaccharide lyase family 8 protein [Mycena floridula]